MNERLPIGTKVRTDKFGTGTVTGYEEGDPPYDSHRYQVTLDNPDEWVFSIHGCLPYFFEREVTVIPGTE